MDELFSDNPLLLLFVVSALGYLAGQVKIKGTSLGVAAVLFVGLGFGFFNPAYNIPDIIFQLGLVLFVYSIGLSSGPAFFKSFKTNGWRDIGYVMTMLICTVCIAVLAHYIFGFDDAVTTGLYTGASTNTTALASIIDMIGSGNAQELQNLVVGYTYSYPLGVIGVMMVLKLMERIFKIDYQAEKEKLRKQYPVGDKLTTRTIKMTNSVYDGHTVRDILKALDVNIIFGRVKHNENVTLANYDTRLYNGDSCLIIGDVDNLQSVTMELGEETDDVFHYDRRTYDIRRIFVSNPAIIGRTLSSLNLPAKYDAVITRIRRGDSDILAEPHTIIESGDRIRFIARRQDLDALSTYFGDSYYQSSRVNIFSFGLGIALGLLLGFVNFELPGGLSFNLGYAGGPLIVGLVLGAWRRTGYIVWSLPYGAHVLLQQIGLMLLLAVIGVRSGHSFLESLGQLSGLNIFLGGVFITILSSIISIFIGYKLFKIPYSLLLGFMSNQPAILDYSYELSNNKIPAIGYTVMFPIAMIMKILFAQILYLILN